MKLLDQFKRDIDSVMELIEKGEEIKARIRFNHDVHPAYKDQVGDSDSVVSKFADFFVELDEYLNNGRRYLLGQNISREELIDMYYNEYLKVLRQAENEN